jgi:hypothetical protein
MKKVFCLFGYVYILQMKYDDYVKFILYFIDSSVSFLRTRRIVPFLLNSHITFTLIPVKLIKSTFHKVILCLFCMFFHT